MHYAKTLNVSIEICSQSECQSHAKYTVGVRALGIPQMTSQELCEDHAFELDLSEYFLTIGTLHITDSSSTYD